MTPGGDFLHYNQHRKLHVASKKWIFWLIFQTHIMWSKTNSARKSSVLPVVNLFKRIQGHAKIQTRDTSCSCYVSAEGSIYPSSSASLCFTAATQGWRLGWASPLPSALSLNYSTKPESCLSVLTRRDWRNLEEFLTASDFIRNSVWPVDGAAAAGNRHTSDGSTSYWIPFDRRHILGLNSKNYYRQDFPAQGTPSPPFTASCKVFQLPPAANAATWALYLIRSEGLLSLALWGITQGPTLQ